MCGLRLALNQVTSSGAWFPRRAWRAILPIAGLSLTNVGCEAETRCWQDGTCPDTAAVKDASADEDASAASPGTSGQASWGGDAAPEVVVSEPSATTGSTMYLDASASTSPSVHPAGSSASEATGTRSPSDGDADATTSVESTGFSTGAETCTSDDQCPGLLCASGSCEVCDPSDHRGCEDSETGNRCRASEGGNACVACIPGDLPPVEGEPCGVNGRGMPRLECVAGIWQTTTCEDLDICKDGEAQVGVTPCGPNADGRYLAECSGGQWVDDTNSCIDDDQCVNGTRRLSDTECGFSGYLEQQCVNGTWLTQSNRCTECQRSYRVPDPLFESSLAERNNIPADPVDPDSVKYMVTLDLSFSSIADATGIECFTSLQELNLSKNQLSDLTPLASLTQLRTLSLAYNALYGSSLAPLGALTELRYLSLEAAAVTSLEGLQTLTLLEELRVPYNHISDVTPLVPLTSLQDLSIYGNPEIECASEAYATLQSRVPVLYSDCP